MNLSSIERLLTEDFTIGQFAEAMHSVMTDYVRMALYAGAEADLSQVARNMEFLEAVRSTVLQCEDPDCSTLNSHPHDNTPCVVILPQA